MRKTIDVSVIFVDDSTSTSVQKNTKEVALSTYPNPAQTVVMFNKTMDRFGLQYEGRVVMTLSDEKQISVEKSANGMYSIGTSTGDIVKFVKENFISFSGCFLQLGIFLPILTFTK